MSAGVHARGTDVSFRDVTMKIPDRGCDQGSEWRHAPETWAEIWEKSVCWVLGQRKTLDFRGSPKPGQRPCGRCRTWFGADGNVIIERLCLSLPYVEKPFNSKVIKSFVPEIRSRKCFSYFGIPMLYIYMFYGHYERFTYRYEYVYFTYSCMAMQHMYPSNPSAPAGCDTRSIFKQSLTG